MKVVMCLPAYNEGRNIGHLLNRMVGNKLLNEIVVVASGCTDDTVEVASRYPVTLLQQSSREGKSSAINLFLDYTDADVVVMASTDTIPAVDCLEHILKHFQGPIIGVVGARPIPVNKPTTVGLAVRILWNAHHLVALQSPKMGEMIAWRNILGEIPSNSSVDEAAIEAGIASLGFSVVYEPRAVVFNKGPETITDLVKQRKRIHLGHLSLHETQRYSVSTMSLATTLKAVISSTPRSLKGLKALMLLCLVEFYSRRKARQSYKAGAAEQTVWAVAETTKQLR